MLSAQEILTWIAGNTVAPMLTSQFLHRHFTYAHQSCIFLAMPQPCRGIPVWKCISTKTAYQNTPNCWYADDPISHTLVVVTAHHCEWSWPSYVLRVICSLAKPSWHALLHKSCNLFHLCWDHRSIVQTYKQTLLRQICDFNSGNGNNSDDRFNWPLSIKLLENN